MSDEPRPTLSALTPASLTLLRASVRRPGPSDGTFAASHPPCVLYNKASRLWELHAYGRLQGTAPDPSALLTILLREASEPGWIARAISSTALNPEDALLPPSVLAERERAFLAAQWAQTAEPLSTLTLDDLD